MSYHDADLKSQKKEKCCKKHHHHKPCPIPPPCPVCQEEPLPPGELVQLKKIKDSCDKKERALVSEPLECLFRSGLGANSYRNRLWLAYDQQIQDDPENLTQQPATYDELEGTYPLALQPSIVFSNGLIHNEFGEVVDLQNAKNMICYLVAGDQAGLENHVTYYSSATVPNGFLVDPWSGIATNHMGAANGAIVLPPPPRNFSDAHAAEMVYLYSKALALDVPFDKYTTDPIINGLILTPNAVNNPNVIADLPLSPAHGNPFTAQNLFRGTYQGNELGPYMSQFFFINFNLGSLQTVAMKFKSDPSLADVQALPPVTYSLVNGFSVGQTVSVHNGDFRESTSPTSPEVPPQAPTTLKFITTGRDLSNWDRSDQTSQAEYSAALALSTLGVAFNPTLPIFAHNVGNSTGASAAVAQEASVWFGNLSRIHGYYWKYFQYRRFRPQIAGLFTHIEKSGLKSYGWPAWYLGLNTLWNSVVADNLAYYNVYPVAKKPNVVWQPGTNQVSYTLHQQVRDFKDHHPSYPAAHSVITGAGTTLLKFIFNGDTALADLSTLKVIAVDNSGGPGIGKPTAVSSSAVIKIDATVPANSDVDIANSDVFDITAGPAPFYMIGAGTKVILRKNTLGPAWTLNQELDKLMFNKAIGRSWIGIHYQADNAESVYMGEAEGIRMFQDLLTSWYQDKLMGDTLEAPEVSITTLDGTKIFVTPSSCLMMQDGKKVPYTSKYYTGDA